jgi:hypothetical protein
MAAAAMWVLAAVPAGAQSLPDPIAPASQGKAQCYEPDLATRTCRSIDEYKLGPDGGILNWSLVLVASQPQIAFTSITKVTVRDGQVCGVVQASDIQDGQFTVAGQPATPDQRAGLEQSLETAEAGILGKEICTAFTPDGEGLIARATVDGVAQPDTQHVIWISDADGYHLGGAGDDAPAPAPAPAAPPAQ